MNTLHDDFEIQWQHRQRALNDAKDNVPSDEVILGMAKKAQKRVKVKIRWISYAAAACLVFGVLLFGLTKQNNKEITFLCNSGCSVQDVIVSANRIVNQ
jgi:hypothetical protein